MSEENNDEYEVNQIDSSVNKLFAANQVLKTGIDRLQMISPVALKLLKLADNENTQTESLIKIFKTEPVLAARVINIVNSSKINFNYQVESISQALELVGVNQIRELVTEQLLYNQLIHNEREVQFDQLFFWQHCLFVANLSKNIAIDLGSIDPDVLYAAGLLHDIGKLLLENHGKITYSDFLMSIDKSEASSENNEKVFFGLSHTEIGLLFCHQLNLPKTITAVVACHHDDTLSSQKYSENTYEIAIVAFADYIAWLHGLGSSKSAIAPCLSSDFMKHIDLNKLNLENLLDRTDRAMVETSLFYGINFPNLNKLRASLLNTAIKIGLNKHLKFDAPIQSHPSPSSLLLPHHSLDPESIVLTTLDAIRKDFGFDRVIMFGMSRDRQGLLVKYCCPIEDYTDLMIPTEAIGGDFLRCLRYREAVIISNSSDAFGRIVMKFMRTQGFVAAPVLRNNRLVGVLYADYQLSNQEILPDYASQLMPIATQLGIALFNAKKFSILKIQSELDPLTRLFNKGKVEQWLKDAYSSNSANLSGFVIGFADIDFFKKFNDSCGHQAGDDVLKIVAEILRTMTRPNDFIGRYGGEEFVFALQNTSREGAMLYGERIRSEVERQGIILSKRFANLQLTISIGIALYHSSFRVYSDQLLAADQAMYVAKKQGRNRVVLYSN